VIDNTLFHLRDAGVIANVHTLRTQYTHLANVKRQRVELNATVAQKTVPMFFCFGKTDLA
jgi:hypothetical protein